MIIFECIESPNPNRLGTYKFNKNRIKFGSHINSDIVIELDDTIEHIFDLYVNEENKSYLNLNNTNLIHINGLRTTALKRIKEGDTFSYSNNTFIIHSLYFDQIPEIGKVLNEKVEQLKQEKSSRLKILKELSEI